MIPQKQDFQAASCFDAFIKTLGIENEAAQPFRCLACWIIGLVGKKNRILFCGRRLSTKVGPSLG
jgi:hypothetical protein